MWEFILYTSIAVGGYISFLDKTPELIIQRKAIPGSSDILMIIGRLAMTFNLITCIPLNVHPCRREICSSLLKMKRELKTWEHFGMTALILAASAIIGVLFPDIINAFTIMGGTGATLFVIFFPGNNPNILTQHSSSLGLLYV